MSAEESGSHGDWIPYACQVIDESDIEAIVEVLKSKFLTQGPRVTQFEDALKSITGARYAVVVSSGTAALHLAYQGLGLNSRDVGLTSPITFVATANAMRYCGAQVEFCDVDETSGLAWSQNFESALESRDGSANSIKLISSVSYSGRMSDLENISRLAQTIGAYVVEDAAHSLGACRNGIKSASCVYSDAATLSFHPVKHVCSGEGGAVLTNDEVLARRVRSLRSHGVEKRFSSVDEKDGGWSYEQRELGWNYRLTDMQSALGMSQMKRLSQSIGRRREIATYYDRELSREPFVRVIKRPDLDAGSSWHLYVVLFRGKEERKAAYDFLHSRGIGAQVHYIPVNLQPYYSSENSRNLKGALTFYSRCLSLPMYPSLYDYQIERVIETLKDFCDTTLLVTE